MSNVFRALADQTRRGAVAVLRERPLSAGELADQFDVSQSTMSAHFAVLREAGLIDAATPGKTIIYRLKMSVLEEALMGLAQTVGRDLKPAPARMKRKEERS